MESRWRVWGVKRCVVRGVIGAVVGFVLYLLFVSGALVNFAPSRSTHLVIVATPTPDGWQLGTPAQSAFDALPPSGGYRFEILRWEHRSGYVMGVGGRRMWLRLDAAVIDGTGQEIHPYELEDAGNASELLDGVLDMAVRDAEHNGWGFAFAHDTPADRRLDFVMGRPYVRSDTRTFHLGDLLACITIVIVGALLGVASVAGSVLVQRRSPEWLCGCGYDRRGLPDGTVCPECGEYPTEPLSEAG